MGWSSLHSLVFAGDVDPVKRRPTSLWPNSNRLVLPGVDVIDHTKFDSDAKIEAVSSTLPLRGRHLEGAVLCGADLRKVDFTGAWLDGAFLNDAQFKGALLDKTTLENAKLKHSSLQGASLINANLQNADFTIASLQGASLDFAEARGAQFKTANLQGASLSNSHLEDAQFVGAQLDAVSFAGAHLEGACLQSAELNGALLGGAHLEKADLSWTYVWRVDVREIAKGGLANAKLHPCLTKDDSTCQNADFSAKNFDLVKNLVEEEVPKGKLKNLALERVKRLNPTEPLYEEDKMAEAWAHQANGGLNKVNPSEIVACR
jgi:uncharacterized protein YjbI with pentapeptide repeats